LASPVFGCICKGIASKTFNKIFLAVRTWVQQGWHNKTIEDHRRGRIEKVKVTFAEGKQHC